MTASQTVEQKRTYCRVCISHCGIVADVVGEEIVKISGDRDHPVTKGYTCPKGRATDRVHHSPDAITHPLMRKNGELVRVSWDEAIDDIAAKLRTIVDESGPHAIGINFGSGLGLDSSGYSMEEALYQALQYPPKFTPLTIDQTAKVMIAGAMGHFPGLNPKTDYDNVEMLIMSAPIRWSAMATIRGCTIQRSSFAPSPSAATCGRSTRCSRKRRSGRRAISRPIRARIMRSSPG